MRDTSSAFRATEHTSEALHHQNRVQPASRPQRTEPASMTMRTFLVRGMLVGLLAGLCVLVFYKISGESAIGNAISFESSNDAKSGVTVMPELVSRNVQSTIGLAVGTSVIGTALGGFFALGFAITYGRVGFPDARAQALALAGAGFVAVHLMPFLKYPASPPAASDPDTISKRTALYFLMLTISVVAAIGACLAQRSLKDRVGVWTATTAAIAGFVALLTLVDVALPDINGVPSGFPASTLWQFRIAALGGQLLMWVVIGLGFGFLANRATRLTPPEQQTIRQPM